MKVFSYVLLAAVLILAIVFFVQSRSSGKNDNTTEVVEMEEVVDEGAGETRLAEDPVVFPDGSYSVDIVASKVNWMGEKEVVKSSHEGTIDIKSGVFSVKEGLLSSGEIVIDMSSIALAEGDSGGDNLLNHLLADDFFGVEEHPEATLKVIGVNGNQRKQEVTGELTIKGNTSNVVFGLAPVVGGADEVLLSGKIIIDRSEFDVRFGSKSFFDDLGDSIIKDEIIIDFLLAGELAGIELE